MSLIGTLGAKLYTSPLQLLDEEDIESVSTFLDLDIDDEVGLIENFSEFGKTYEVFNYKSMNNGRSAKVIGGSDDGGIILTLGKDFDEFGQSLLISHQGGSLGYPYKIVFLGYETDDNSIFFGGKIVSLKNQMGNVNGIVRLLVTIEITTGIFFGNSGNILLDEDDNPVIDVYGNPVLV